VCRDPRGLVVGANRVGRNLTRVQKAIGSMLRSDTVSLLSVKILQVGCQDHYLPIDDGFYFGDAALTEIRHGFLSTKYAYRILETLLHSTLHQFINRVIMSI
jgi:hypothetical protein